MDTVVALKMADVTKIFIAPNDVFEMKVVSLTVDQISGVYLRSGEHDFKLTKDRGRLEVR